MQAEYDFSGGVRGKYAKRYARGTNIDFIRVNPWLKTLPLCILSRLTQTQTQVSALTFSC
jgi:hypothetical protein